MTNPASAVFGFLFAASLFAAENLPHEVADFIERREVCEHFRQEPWPEGASVEDTERRAFIAGQFERFCRGSDNAIQELKKKYENDRAVMERLGQYEPNIEGK
ncbi:MAG: hypothetical protein ACRERY_11970 [Pseudomonas sp.]